MATKTNTAAKTETKKTSAEKTGKTAEMKESKAKKTLEDLFEEELKDIYNAEQQLLKAIPEMVEAAHNEDLADAFSHHLEQTKKQVERLEKIFDRLHIDKNEEETCEAMQGLIKEGQQIIADFDESAVRDSALIIAAQKIEHYEIASYGSLCELADVLGYDKIATMLDRTLEEEESTDHMLTEIAMDVNDEAYEMSHEEEMAY
jgi:ferritin-like metal-binding protein YciE